MKRLFVLSLFFVPTLLNAQSVDILWQGNNYVSPFYEGLPLWSKQSEITFVAIPQGLGDPATLNYVWSRNGTILGLVSGIGVNSLTFVDGVLSKPVTIKVEILKNNDEVLAENSINIGPVEGAVYVYEKNPLYGFIFHREVSENYHMEEEEATLTAFPFYFTSYNKTDPGIIYSWNSGSGAADNRNSVTYRTPTEGSGRANISLQVKHEGFLTQGGFKRFSISFGDE